MIDGQESFHETQSKEIVVTEADGVANVSFPPESDLYNKERLEQAIKDCLEKDSIEEVIANLERVEFMDVTTLGLLVSAVRLARLADKKFAVRKPSHQYVLTLLKITGLDKIFWPEDFPAEIPTALDSPGSLPRRRTLLPSMFRRHETTYL